MVKKTAFAALIAILVPGLLLFSGCRHKGHHGKAAYFIMDYIVETLDLTEPQEAQLNEFKDELVEKGQDIRHKHRAFHDEIIVQIKSDTIDQQRLKDLIAENRAQMDEMISLMIARLAEFHQTLTPEQKAKLVNKLKNFKKLHGSGWE